LNGSFGFSDNFASRLLLLRLSYAAATKAAAVQGAGHWPSAGSPGH
jgi:hypothetical protein